MGSFEVCLSDTLVKIDTFLFELVQDPIGQHDTLAGNVEWQIEQQGQVRLQVLVHPMFQNQKLGAIETPPTTLIGVGRIAEAVADHPLTASQCRFDKLG